MLSYVTVQEANDYFSMRLDVSMWEEADTETRKRALATATRQIDTLSFAGTKALPTQPLQFPRRQNIRPLTEHELFKYRERLANLNSEIPTAVKYATCEQALFLITKHYKRPILTEEDAKFQNLRDNAIESYTIDDVTVKFSASAFQQAPQTQSQIASDAMHYLKPYIRRMARLV